MHGIGFGLPALNDPDELIFELGATRMLTGPTLNPGWFGHPATITMYVLALVNASSFGLGFLFGQYSGPAAFMNAIYADPGIVMLPGRMAMAAFSLVTVWQTWRLARSLAGDLAGLFAALLLACSTVHVHYSQIIRSDLVGTVFVLMTVAASLRIARDGRRADYVWAALGVALAMASKWPFGIAAIAVVGAQWVRFSESQSPLKQQLKPFALFLLLAPVFLVLVSPYLVLDFGTVLRNLGGEARTQHLGATGEGLFGNMWWYLSGPLWKALGLPGLIMAAAGLVLMARQRGVGRVILPVLIVYGAMICLHGLRWERWVLPMLPLLAIAGGLAAVRLVELVRQRSAGAFFGSAATGMVMSVALVQAIPAWSDATARMNDTRQVATNWARQHVPPGSTVMIEHFAFDLIDAPWTIVFPMGDAGCVDAKGMITGRVDYKVVDAARGSRSNVDYGTVAASKRDTCRADYAIIMEMERYRLEQHRFPAEYGAYQTLLQSMTVEQVIHPEPGRTSGPVMTILKRKDVAGSMPDARQR